MLRWRVPGMYKGEKATMLRAAFPSPFVVFVYFAVIESLLPVLVGVRSGQLPVGPSFEKTAHFRCGCLFDQPDFPPPVHYELEARPEVGTGQACGLRLIYAVFILRAHLSPVSEAFGIAGKSVF